MAFTQQTLGVIVQPIGGEGMRFISYRTDDDQATVTASEYFAGAGSYGVRVNDLIFVSPVSADFDPYILVVDTVDAEGDATATIGDEEMLASIYDPQGIAADAFARANHTGTQAISTIDGLQTELDGKLDASDIGTTVQAYDSNLDTLSSGTTTLGTTGLTLLEAETVGDAQAILGIVATFATTADGDGAGGGTDIGAGLQTLVNTVSAAGGGEVRIPFNGTGIFRLADAVEMKTNVTVRVEPGVKFDHTASTDYAVKFTGVAGTEIATSGDYTRGDDTLTTGSAHGLVVGDWAQIIGQRNALSVDAGDWRCGNGTVSLNYAYFSEWLPVAEVTSTTVFRSGATLMFPDYRDDVTLETDTDRTGTTIRKMTPVENAHWIGGEWIATGSYGVALGLYAANCTFQSAIIRRGSVQGGSVHWDKCYRCFGVDIQHYNDPSIAWDYSTLHGTLNRYRTISSQECGFIGCRDEFGAQSFDPTYGGDSTPYLVNVRTIIDRCETYRCFEGVTSHPGCFQEMWTNNRFLECYRAGIVIRGLQPTIANNLVTSSTELLTIADPTEGTDYSVGIDLYNGYTQGAHIHGNKVFGFRYAFRVRDGSTDSRYTNVDALIENNEVSECYGALITDFSTAVFTDALRRISYIGNSHRRMQRFVVNLGQYSPGVDVQSNTLNGDFVNAADEASVYFLLTNANCPGLNITHNRWYRTATGNSGKTLRMVQISSISDTTTFPSATWAKRTKIRDNFVQREPTAKFSVNNAAYQQQDDFSDVDGSTSYGAYGGLLSGEYTPALTNSTNVAASTPGVCQYLRVGNIVNVVGTVQIDATTASSQTVLEMSLPIASDFTASTDAAGTFYSSSAGSGGRIIADTTDDRVQLIGVPASDANLSYGFSFSYAVK